MVMAVICTVGFTMALTMAFAMGLAVRLSTRLAVWLRMRSFADALLRLADGLFHQRNGLPD
jgi:hypothetical protein